MVASEEVLKRKRTISFDPPAPSTALRTAKELEGLDAGDRILKLAELATSKPALLCKAREDRLGSRVRGRSPSARALVLGIESPFAARRASLTLGRQGLPAPRRSQPSLR